MVSIVINSYKDNQDTLRDVIESYQKQTVSCEVEIIVSTIKNDPAIDTAKSMNVDKICTGATPSIWSQLNRGVNYATGDWFCYASGNDEAMPNKLKDELSLLLKTGKKVCYSACYIVNENGEITGVNEFHPYDYEKHLLGNFTTDVLMINMEVLRKYLPFRKEYGNSIYWDMWLRVYEGEGDVFVYNPKPNYLYCIDGMGRHSKKKKNPAIWNRDELTKAQMLRSHGVEYEPRIKKITHPYKKIIGESEIIMARQIRRDGTKHGVVREFTVRKWKRMEEVYGKRLRWVVVGKITNQK